MITNNLNTLNRDNIECYTEKYGVEILINHLKNKFRVGLTLGVEIVIWCPCDTKDSEFVKVLDNLPGFRVIYSHIDNGQDCFEYEPEEEFDIIITNPPFKNKTKFMKRFMSFNKPFAILLPVGCIGDNGIPNLFIEKNRQMQLLIPDKRMEFKNQKKSGISFKSIYVCNSFLDKDITLCRLNKPRKDK